MDVNDLSLLKSTQAGDPGPLLLALKQYEEIDRTVKNSVKKDDPDGQVLLRAGMEKVRKEFLSFSRSLSLYKETRVAKLDKPLHITKSDVDKGTEVDGTGKFQDGEWEDIEESNADIVAMSALSISEHQHSESKGTDEKVRSSSDIVLPSSGHPIKNVKPLLRGSGGTIPRTTAPTVENKSSESAFKPGAGQTAISAKGGPLGHPPLPRAIRLGEDACDEMIELVDSFAQSPHLLPSYFAALYRTGYFPGPLPHLTVPGDDEGREKFVEMLIQEGPQVALDRALLFGLQEIGAIQEE